MNSLMKMSGHPFALTLTSLCAIPFAQSYAQNAQADKMNIIIIVADDLGWSDVGFHGSDILTPHLDKFAEEGIQLNRFYTAPISSPTRAGLLTGRYPTRLGIRETVIPPWRDYGLSPEEETIPEMLAKAGYPNRAIIGKWHLGHSRREYYPLSHGFTHFYGHLNGNIDYFTHQRDGQLDWHNDWESSYDEGYSTDLIADRAVNCIEKYTAEGPYLLYVAFNAPHTPLQAKQEDIVLYTDNLDLLKGKEKKRAIYSAMVTCMDKGIGRIMEALDKSGKKENTLVLFMSDNGAERNGGGLNEPLRGNKGQEWDGGVRVPAVISCPKLWKGNRTVNQVMGFVDIMPTIREILDIQGEPHRPFDGINIASVLDGKVKRIDRDFYLGCGALVNNNHKFILPGGNNSIKINEPFLSYYPDDPYEKKNAINKYKREAKRMKQITEQFDAIAPINKLPPFGEGREGFAPPFEWKIDK